jgi:hypothetical protein
MGTRTAISCGNLYAGRGWLAARGVSARPRITIRHKGRPGIAYRVKAADSHNPASIISQLELAVSVRNARVFEKLLQDITWEHRSASEFNRTVDLALRMGAYSDARRIAQIGQVQYPQDDKLQRYCSILAEPVVTRREVPFDPSIRANRDWLRTHRNEYQGKWIGLQNGNLVGSADSIDELMNSLESNRGVLVTRVY